MVLALALYVSPNPLRFTFYALRFTEETMPMRVPLSWLREDIEINVTPAALARRLTLAGQEVEHIITIRAEGANIYTGRVARLERHPNADRLYLAAVDYGAGK